MSKNQIVIEIDESALERVQNLLNSYQKSWHTYYNDVTEMANENGIEIVSIDDRVKFCKENKFAQVAMNKADNLITKLLGMEALATELGIADWLEFF